MTSESRPLVMKKKTWKSRYLFPMSQGKNVLCICVGYILLLWKWPKMTHDNLCLVHKRKKNCDYSYNHIFLWMINYFWELQKTVEMIPSKWSYILQLLPQSKYDKLLNAMYEFHFQSTLPLETKFRMTQVSVNYKTKNILEKMHPFFGDPLKSSAHRDSLDAMASSFPSPSFPNKSVWQRGCGGWGNGKHWPCRFYSLASFPLKIF